MKLLAALALSLAVLAQASPAPAQDRHDRGERNGGAVFAPRPGGGDRGGDRRGGGEPHRGYPEPRGGYPEPRGGYPEARRNYPEARGGYPDPRGYPEARGPYGEPPRGAYGYPAPPYGYRPGPDSLGADWGGQQDEVRAGVRQGRYMGLARVIGMIRQRTPGRQLDAGLEQWGGRAVYRVRWAAPNGRRIDYIVDAQSGAILRVDGG